MFGNIGGIEDPERAQRSLAAIGLAGAVVSGLLSVSVWLGAQTVARFVPTSESSTLVLVELIEPDVLPELPPAVRSGSRRAARPEGAASTTGGHREVRQGTESGVRFEPDELLDAIVELEPVEEKSLTLLEKLPDYRGRSFGRGEADTVTDGVRLGAGGTAREGDGVHYVEVAQHEVRLRHKVDPIYPPTEASSASCKVSIRIAESGRPTGMEVSGCAPIFERSTRSALMTWRWSRPTIDGVPTPVTTGYTVNFEPER